jgi:membrane protease YdiL (CAAX protease family)
MKTTFRVALFYILALILCIIFGGIQLKVLKIDFYTISLPQFAPAIAALVMLALFRKENVRLTIALTGAQTLRYIGAIGIPLFVSGVLFLSYSQFVGSVNIEPISGIPLLILLGGNLVGAFGEELGWRGYLQRIVEERANVLIASVVIGVLWGLWHILYYQYGPLYLLFFVISTLAESVVIGWLLRGTDYNVVIAGIFHFAINASFYPVREARADLRLMMLFGLVWFAVAVIIVVIRRKDFLSPRKSYVSG